MLYFIHLIVLEIKLHVISTAPRNISDSNENYRRDKFQAFVNTFGKFPEISRKSPRVLNFRKIDNSTDRHTNRYVYATENITTPHLPMVNIGHAIH